MRGPQLIPSHSPLCKYSPHHQQIQQLNFNMKESYNDNSDTDEETREFRAKCRAAKEAAEYRRDQEAFRRQFERNGNTLQEAARVPAGNHRRIVERRPNSTARPTTESTTRRSNNSTGADNRRPRQEPRMELRSPVTERARGSRNTGASREATGEGPSTRRTHRVARPANETGTGTSASSNIRAERGGQSYSTYTSER